jgi:HAE1 family hydrophobic/amphiphilic exporter-1
MSALTKLALQRPLTMLMILLSLLIMGYQGYNRMLLDSFPKIDFPFVTVSVIFPGASPEDVEELVIKPIEDAVATIAGIDELNSTAVEGAGNITIAFVEGTDGNRAAIDVERQVATVRGLLPAEAEDPTITKIDINAIPVLIMSLSGPQSQDTLFQLADDEIKTRLQAVPGVASVGVTGGREREIQVLVDPAKLAAFGIPLGDVQRRLAENNITFPAGSIEEGRQKIPVRSVGEFTSLADIENLVVREGQANSPSGSSSRGRVFLRDVATVGEGYAERNSILRYNGRDSVSISVVKSSDANTVETVDELKKAIEEINDFLPPGAELITILDNSEFIRESVAAVLEDLFLAVLITGIVILVFLHTVRSTFIVILAVPTCIVYTFLIMWMLDFSLNQLTLLALTLVIGILVDDAIVVIENIERHLEMGKPPMQAALEGRAEIGFAALTITLVDVVVYLPVAFTSGIIGQFFFSYGVTVAVATLFSLFVAFTLTPMLAGLWLEDKSKPKTPPRGLQKIIHYILLPVNWFWKGFVFFFEKGFNLLALAYAATLRFFLWNFATQILAVLLAVVALAAGVYLVAGGFVGSEFLPQTDDGQIRIAVEMPAGTNLEATDSVVRQVERLIINNVPETSAILAQVGTSAGGGPFGGGSRAANTATVNLILVDKADRDRSTSDVVDALRPLMQRLPEAIISLTLNAEGGGGGGSPIEVRLYGTDTNVLIDLAEQVEETIKAVPGAIDVKNTGAARSPENRLVVDRDLALDLDLSPAQVATTLRTALSGSPVGKYQPPDGSTEIDITLRLAESSRQDLNQLLQTPVKYINGQPVTLDRVVTLERDQAPARISRADRQRVLNVGSGMTADITVGELTDDIEAAIQEQVEFPAGYGFRFIGASESQREAFAQLGQSILLGIILIYMLLVALYQSWLQPLAIMFSLPVTLVGAIGGLWLTGNTLNIISLLGIILLTGVVTKNAILIVDFTNNLRENEGYSRKDALVAAGRLRLRAILMTTLALVFALMPLLLGAGAGSEGRAPLAAVVIGGSISSTLLTLILVPVVYNFFDWGGGLFSRFVKRVLGTDQEAERVLVDPEDADTEKKPASPRQPSAQPGSALSLNPPTGSDAA